MKSIAGRHITYAPRVMTYASVVSREYASITLTLAALNDLKVKMGDIDNAYLMLPLTMNVCTVLVPEFGADVGKCAIIVRALYGLKSTGTAFRNHLSACMDHLGWKPYLGHTS
jgi:hypothetical protein